MSKSKAQQTQEKILKVATHIFSVKGYDGLSTRELAIAAGVNLSVPYYHFGSKEKLYEACIQRFIKKIDKVRRENLATIDTDGEHDKYDRLEKILIAFTEPHYQLLTDEEGYDYAKLIARCALEPLEISVGILNKYYLDTRILYSNAIARVLEHPESVDTIIRVFSFFVEYMLGAPIEKGVINNSNRLLTADEVSDIQRLVVTFGIGGFNTVITKGRL
ncbi:TetR/AcrR family transcriptional regulator [Bowmanella pacifica]|uniref:TetR family transcriptional regulator n=1 Tax=Bowmanella pacifica TaxID=502051 RepID=A0A918DIL4_9ALTE|nr:TetR/AcrR family transcriptional regulator [Bowmanella pacifica]GGO67097.1 TetR family transcriptional regulator [Bowmanella pacifica]